MSQTENTLGFWLASSTPVDGDPNGHTCSLCGQGCPQIVCAGFAAHFYGFCLACVSELRRARFGVSYRCRPLDESKKRRVLPCLGRVGAPFPMSVPEGAEVPEGFVVVSHDSKGGGR